MSIFKDVFNLLTGNWKKAEEPSPRKKDWRWEYRIGWDNKHQLWFVSATDCYGKERYALKCSPSYEKMVEFCNWHAKSLKPEEPIYLGKLPKEEQ